MLGEQKDRWGIFAVNQRGKVISEPRVFQGKRGSFKVVRVSVGFKQGQGMEWVNPVIDILLSGKLTDTTVAKGDVVFFSGRMDCTKYKDQFCWRCWADSISSEGSGQAAPRSGERPAEQAYESDDIPF